MIINPADVDMNDVLSVDTETYFADDYSLTKMNAWTYCEDERFKCETVQLFNHEVEFVGAPIHVDWELLHNKHLLMHNAKFDARVLARLRADGVIPEHVQWLEIFDTADMAAYLRCLRALKSVAKEYYSITLDKSVRAKMEGKTYEQAQLEGWGDEYKNYAMMDAIIPYRFFKDYKHLWPQMEAHISKLNRESGWQGIRVDVEALTVGMNRFKEIRFESQKLLPWEWDRKKHKTPIAACYKVAQCRKDGLKVPASFDKRDPEVKKWVDENSEEHPWITAVRDWDKADTAYKKLKVLEDALRLDDTYPFELKYHGPHTGRFSGAARFNMQNLNRDPIMGVNIRNLFIPREGYKFIVMDFESIEGIIFPWLINETKVIEEIEQGGNIYEMHARDVMDLDWGEGSLKAYDKINGTNHYTLAKVEKLALGYQGWTGALTAYANMYGITLTEKEKLASCFRYREKNVPQVLFWKEMQDMLNASARNKEDCVISTPAGYDLVYRNVVFINGGTEAVITRGKKHEPVYGGRLTENVIQSTAGSILKEAWIRLEEAGYHVVTNVHDELIIEVPADGADDAFKECQKLITQRPEWAKTLPIRADGEILDRYTKI